MLWALQYVTIHVIGYFRQWRGQFNINLYSGPSSKINIYNPPSFELYLRPRSEYCVTSLSSLFINLYKGNTNIWDYQTFSILFLVYYYNNFIYKFFAKYFWIFAELVREWDVNFYYKNFWKLFFKNLYGRSRVGYPPTTPSTNFGRVGIPPEFSGVLCIDNN